METIGASEFKAHCLGLIDEVGRTGTRITITKRGRPVAQLVRYAEGESAYPQESLVGTATIVGDIETAIASPEDWSAIAGNNR